MLSNGLFQPSVPQLTLAVADNGARSERPRQLVPVIDLAPSRIIFIVIRKDIVDLMSAADVLFLSHRSRVLDW